MNKYSAVSGCMSKGCKKCIKGAKLVLFITGLCHNACYYCPLSKERKGKDLTLANERPVIKDQDLIMEAKAMNALGAGITGGEPLKVMKKTLHYIKLLKKTFGSKFHIHLYTAMQDIKSSDLRKLEQAGLDELRIHPVNLNKKYWPLIKKATKYGFDVGVEVPAIPGREEELIELADYLNEINASFLNLNELEFTETNLEKLRKAGFKSDEKSMASVRKSKQTAMKVINHAKKLKLNVYYCSSALKDAVQFTERLKRMAKNTAKKHELITSEGTLVKAVIYHKKNSINKLKELNKKLKAYFNKGGKRLELGVERIEEIKLPSDFEMGILESYPTYDETELNYTPILLN